MKDGKVVFVGKKGSKEVALSGLTPNTTYKASDYRVAYDQDDKKELSDKASGIVDGTNLTTKAIPVTGVALDKSTLALDTGKTGQLSATVAPANASNKAVSWSSDNTEVATVDSSGKVTAVKAGTAKITVKTADGAKTAVCTVTVKDPDPPTEG